MGSGSDELPVSLELEAASNDQGCLRQGPSSRAVWSKEQGSNLSPPFCLSCSREGGDILNYGGVKMAPSLSSRLSSGALCPKFLELHTYRVP